ncbi:MAG: FAD-binding oxidoreductase [Actinomycetota bacterium]
MTALRSTVARLFGKISAEVPGAPPADFTLAPTTAEECARVLDMASEHRLVVLPWGGGTHQGIGGRVAPNILLVTTALGEMSDDTADLTITVGAGARVAAMEERLGASRQTAVLPEQPGMATVGGVVASGSSGWRRLRYGPTRDRVIEVVLATGDGRVVRAGARLVKNVTGYDLPRLATGSFGSLGVITSVSLKLWPVPPAAATVRVGDAAVALSVAYRPLAVLETPAGPAVYLGGTAAEVDAQTAALGGRAEPGHDWPDDPGGEFVVSIRVPPASTADVVRRLPPDAGFVAAHGVGEVRAALNPDDVETPMALRRWAEGIGGAVVVLRAHAGHPFDSWGTPPSSTPLQRRIRAAFDPVGVMVPGRMPGDR